MNWYSNIFLHLIWKCCPVPNGINEFVSHAITLWLRHYATNRKVAGSRPNDVIEFVNLPNPSDITNPLWLTTSPPPVYRLFRQSGILNISQHYSPARPPAGITLLIFLLVMNLWVTENNVSTYDLIRSSGI
jgi:hypothetical protein